MLKTLRLLSTAALLVMPVTTGAIAANYDNGRSATTNAPIGPQTAAPSTGVVGPNRNTTGKSAQTTGPAYPNVVGPTGSHESDATNPNRSGVQGSENDGNAGSGNSGGSGRR